MKSHRLLLVTFGMGLSYLLHTTSLALSNSLAPSNSSDDFDSQIREIRLEQRQSLVEVVELNEQMFEKGVLSEEELSRSRLSLLALDLKLAETPERRLEILEQQLSVMEANYERLAQMFEDGVVNTAAKQRAHHAVLEAKIAVLEEKKAQSNDESVE